MKKLLLVLFVGSSFVGFSQEKDVVDTYKESKKFYLGVHVNLGPTIIPDYGDLTSSINLQLKKKNGLGFGIDLSNLNYSSPNFGDPPALDRIENYDFSRTSLPDFIANGTTKDEIVALSFYYSVGYKLAKGLYLDLQAGPSLTWIEQREYTFKYFSGISGGFGGFSFGSSGPYVGVESTGMNEFSLGAYLRASLQISIWERTVIQLSPIVIFNRDQSAVGLQFGFVFGKGYKKNTM